MSFRIDDRVCLKTGGPTMTVRGISLDEESVHVTWSETCTTCGHGPVEKETTVRADRLCKRYGQLQGSSGVES
jgi:uncharacterized protein YodC (DUF2158 family)